MDYNVKYSSMVTALENINSTAKSLSGYSQRLVSVKSTLGLFTSLLGYRTGVNTRANVVRQLQANVLKTWNCLNEVRTAYYTSEQIAYRLISGDRSINIGDGLAPVSLPISVALGRQTWFKLFWNFLFPAPIHVGAALPLVLWPQIPWWIFEYLRYYRSGKMEINSGTTVIGVIESETPAPQDVPGSGAAMVPYTGKYKFSNFSVVAGFSDEYCYKQGNYKKFIDKSGKNVGCTATAEAIVVSIAKGKAVSPNKMGWGSGGAQWKNSHVIKGSKNFSTDKKLKTIAAQLAKGNAVIVRANSGHTVAAVGLKNGADLSKLKPSDILIVDPATGKLTTLDKAAAGGCHLNNGWSLMIAN